VFQDRDGGTAEFEDQFPGRGDVEHVRVAELLALELFEVVREIAVERGLLVRVFPVAQFLGERQADREGGLRFLGRVEVGGDGRVVGRGALENLDGKTFAGLQGRRTLVLVHFREDHGIVRRIDHHRDRVVVLRRRPEHAGAPDVDLLDRLLAGDALLRHGLFEGVEIHDDGEDAVLRGLFAVFREVAAVEEPPVDLRVQGLDPAIEHLGKSGEIRDLRDGNPEGGDEFGGAAGGKDLHPVAVEAFGQFVESGLVGDRDEGAGNTHGWRSMIRPPGPRKAKSGLCFGVNDTN
jgi:hypothetical protein